MNALPVRAACVALLFAILSATSLPALAAGSCGWLARAEQNTVAATTAVGASIMRNTVRPVSDSALRSCLSQIEGLGGAFSFDIPSNLFGSLLSEACTTATGAVNAAANTYINQNVQYPQVMQASVGAGQNGLNYNVNNDSSSVANTIWNQAVGSKIP